MNGMKKMWNGSGYSAGIKPQMNVPLALLIPRGGVAGAFMQVRTSLTAAVKVQSEVMLNYCQSFRRIACYFDCTPASGLI